MATPTATFEGIRSQLKNRKYAPIYILHGEEGFFIDELVKEFEAIVAPEERDFNLYTLYAPQVDMGTVMDVCRRYPMMADYQVVILKEAQAIRSDDLNQLHHYAEHLSSSTILVVCCRGVAVKAKDLVASTVAAGGVVFESKKLNDSRTASAISQFIKERGLNIEPKGLAMLRDYVGSDLSRLYNEIDKLTIALGANATVTPESIERHIGMSKDYNNFELLDAVSRKDAVTVFKVIEYFRRNPKSNPTVMTSSQLFRYFSNLLIAWFTPDRSDSSLMAALGFKSAYALRSYREGMRCYNAWQTIEIISAIRKFDTASKGIDSRSDEYDLLRELMFRILNARGDIATR